MNDSTKTEITQDERDAILRRSIWFAHDRATCDEAGRSSSTYLCEYHRGYEDGIDAICMHFEPMLVEQVARLGRVRAALSHHFTEEHDPCQDRGVGWPCDVADAFGYESSAVEE